jgi:hypothetical protein
VSAAGTPSISQITWAGSGSEKPATRSAGWGRAAHRVDELVDDVRHPRPQGLDATGGECAGHQFAQPGVLGRVHPIDRAGGEHLEALLSAAGRNRQRPGEALVDEHLADVLIAADQPDDAAVG